MKFGVREICDVVLKAKNTTTIGKKVFYKNEPVIYFDSLKTSSMEGAATTVYAQGGKGNARLVAWEGERTVTFTMEDALISPAGFMILSGAGLVEANGTATEVKPVDVVAGDIRIDISDKIEKNEGDYVRKINIYSKKALKEPFTFTFKNGSTGSFTLSSNNHDLVAMTENIPTGYEFGAVAQFDATDDIFAECFGITNETGASNDVAINLANLEVTALQTTVGTTLKVHTTEQVAIDEDGALYVSKKPYIHGSDNLIYVMVLDNNGEISTEPYLYSYVEGNYVADKGYRLVLKTNNYIADASAPTAGNIVLVDYYVEKATKAQQIEITADKFGGNYYLEASTLFRNTSGKDMPAEFIIPNCKIQSNFTFTMASSGDPSTFTFTMDAFPDYTRFDRTKKVLAAIQIIEDDEVASGDVRVATSHNYRG